MRDHLTDEELGAYLTTVYVRRAESVPQGRAEEIMQRAQAEVEEPAVAAVPRWLPWAGGVAAAAIVAAVIAGVAPNRDHAMKYLPAAPTTTVTVTGTHAPSPVAPTPASSASVPDSFPSEPFWGPARAPQSTGEELSDAEVEQLHTALTGAIRQAGTVSVTSRVFGDTPDTGRPDEAVLTHQFDYRDPTTPRSQLWVAGDEVPHEVAVGNTRWLWEKGSSGFALSREDGPDQAWRYVEPIDAVFLGFAWKTDQGDAVWRLPEEDGLARYRLVDGRGSSGPLNPDDSRNVVDLWVDPSTHQVRHMIHTHEGGSWLIPKVEYGVEVVIKPPSTTAPTPTDLTAWQ